jgi:hypothetical protein
MLQRKVIRTRESLGRDSKVQLAYCHTNDENLPELVSCSNHGTKIRSNSHSWLDGRNQPRILLSAGK